MMKKIVCTILMLVITATSSATVINIPADWPTIQQGIDASSDGDTVLVQPGTYYENINFNGHNIVLGSLFLTTGDTSYIDQTVIDGDSAGTVVVFENGESATSVLTGFTVQNGYSYNGGGIYCNQSHPTILYNDVIDNYALSSGGGIYCTNYSDPEIINNKILNNYAQLRGGGICLWNTISNATLFNKIEYNFSSIGGGIYAKTSAWLHLERDVIAYNQSLLGGGVFYRGHRLYFWRSISTGNIASLSGGGLYIASNFDSRIINSILWADSAGNETSEIYDHHGDLINALYSDIDGGWDGYEIINADPLFRDPENGDFHLMSVDCGFSTNSPCIDSGWPDELDSLLDCSWGLGGHRSDIGIYSGGWPAVKVEEEITQNPISYILLQNYPNPFNARTTIRFVLPEPQDVELTVYDLLGRRVETLKDVPLPAGVHNVRFDASDYPSGVYFARLQAGGISKSVKMLLLK
jgi:hypothetical protein